jgi:hypothetical protein
MRSGLNSYSAANTVVITQVVCMLPALVLARIWLSAIEKLSHCNPDVGRDLAQKNR